MRTRQSLPIRLHHEFATSVIVGAKPSYTNDYRPVSGEAARRYRLCPLELAPCKITYCTGTIIAIEQQLVANRHNL